MDIDLLTQIPLFAKLTREELGGLADLLNRKDVPAHQTVFWIGDDGSDFYIVQVGRVQIVEPDEQGKEIILATSGAGSFFGEISLLDGGPRTATVRTLADCIFLTLNRRDFLGFLERHPIAAIHVLTVLGQRQRETLQMVRGMKNVNQVIEERQTLGQCFADWFAVWMGSWTFIIVQTILFVIWMIVNVILVESNGQWDPYPFVLLNLVLAFVSGYAAPIIMMSQNRQSDKDRIKAELDYQVNVKAHHEVMQLHRKLDQLASTVEALGFPARPKTDLHDTEPPPAD